MRWPPFGHLGVAAVYLLASACFGLFGWRLQHVVLHPPPPPGQMYAVVFVRDAAADVNLSAAIDPRRPWRDRLAVSVTNVPPARAGWLLVVECPNGAAGRRAVRLYSAVGSQAQSASTLVTYRTGTGSGRSGIPFGCFRRSSPGPGTSGFSASLTGVSVAGLQLDAGMVGAAGLPVLYAQQGKPGGAVRELVQVLPGAACPAATPSAAPSAAAPSAVPHPAAADPYCLRLAAPGASFVRYGVPGIRGSEQTSETLGDVDYKAFQISMYPAGSTAAQANGDEAITWKAPSAEDPSFAATSTTSQLGGQKDLFASGILFGIFGGLLIAGLDHLCEARQEREPEPAVVRIPH